MGLKWGRLRDTPVGNVIEGTFDPSTVLAHWGVIRGFKGDRPLLYRKLDDRVLAHS